MKLVPLFLLVLFLCPDVDFLKGDFSKAKKLLKWKPIYNTDDLIEDMISSELENS